MAPALALGPSYYLCPIMWIRAALPNALTCANLVCGVLGIVQVLSGNAEVAFYFSLAAGVFDFFDGFVARWLGVSSPLGRELDSLADVVTFGVLPSLVIRSLILSSGGAEWMGYAALSVAVCAALRLAKFNIDTRQSEGFLGLPTPAMGIWACSLPGLLAYEGGASWASPAILLGFAWALSALMVSELPLIALKFKGLRWQGNQSKWLFLAALVLVVPGSLLMGWPFAGVSLVMLLYLILSLVSPLFSPAS